MLILKRGLFRVLEKRSSSLVFSRLLDTFESIVSEVFSGGGKKNRRRELKENRRKQWRQLFTF